MTIRITRRRAVLGLLVVVALGLASFAIAAWLVSSNGQGSARAGALQAPSISPVAANVGTTCVPGSSCDLEIRVTNPNSGALVLTATSANVAGDGTAPAPGCPNGSMTILNRNPNITIPPGISEHVIIDGAQLASDAPTQCQNQTFLKGVHGDFSTP